MDFIDSIRRALAIRASGTGNAEFGGPRERSVQCAGPHGLHRMAYVEWGDPCNPRVLICVHGLTRNGRDFDYFARAMSDHYRVVCPDVVGRGRSDWLTDKGDYGFPLYVSDMVTLIARLDVESVHWVGTSMGGIIGMFLAGLPKSPIRRLVLNDVGPLITVESLKRIAKYVGRAPVFATIDDADAWIRQVSAPFGPLTDEQWRHLVQYSVKPIDRGFEMIYDPAIGDVFRNAPLDKPIDLWGAYQAVACPTLAIRGAESDLLEHDTLLRMAETGPKATIAEIADVGHAPMLMDAPEINLVRAFLCEE